MPLPTAYGSYLLGQTLSAQRAAKKSVPSIKFGANYLVAYGGFQAIVPANQAKSLLKVPGVAAVQTDSVEHPDALDSATYIGATQVWPSLGGDKQGRPGHEVRRPRHRHLAGEPNAG